MTQVTKIPILTVALEAKVSELISGALASCHVTSIAADPDKVMEPVDPPPVFIICGPPEQMGATELAQSLRMVYPEQPIFYACYQRDGYQRALFIKNGFSDSFLLPVDNTVLNQTIKDELAKSTFGIVKSYHPVKLIDIKPGAQLDFDTAIFLPMNNKYIQFTTAGDPIDEERAQRLTKHKVNSVFVGAEQMPQFYKYTAKRLNEMSGGFNINLTEKREKLGGAVRDLMSGMFADASREATFEVGQQILKDCGEIVKTFILNNPENDWYKRISDVLSERGDTYSHAGNVSTFAALFSIGLSIGKPADMAMAGLLHDIGKVELPPDLQEKTEDQMNKQELEEYRRHPELSVNLIKKRKLIVPDIIYKTILQHHERYNGTGYPNGTLGDRITKEAQVLALADQLDYLTTDRPGHKRMTPSEAINSFRQMVIDDPSKMYFNPELLKRVIALFFQKLNHK